MKIAVVGTGYVGLVSGTCLAEMGNQVTCVDVDQKKISMLKNGVIPIYEPGLESLVKSNHDTGRMQFTTDIEAAIHDCEVLMIAVGTPPQEDGSADLQHVLKVAETIGQTIKTPKVIVTKSTVPIGTGDKVRDKVRQQLTQRGVNVQFSVASNPEFLKEGAAVSDFMRPDRIVIGCDDDHAKEVLGRMYQPFVLNGHRVIFMDIRSAELTKYAANSLLATKISFVNELARVAEVVGADMSAVRQGIGSDARIGMHFIYAGVGYGGSCFPKDVSALVNIGREVGLKLSILEAVEEVNQSQRAFFVDKISRHFKGELKGRKFAVWGLAFKPETDDIREAPALDVIESLLKAGATVTAYDPIAADHVKGYFKGQSGVTLVDDQYEVLDGADALLLITEWKPFRSPDFPRMKALLKNAVIFDGRNQYEPATMKALGFAYQCIGRAPV
ncbi:MAG: UDP-glucose/GDP-mannose dehydrogenase family protein [Pseudomonadota bacterium]